MTPEPQALGVLAAGVIFAFLAISALVLVVFGTGTSGVFERPAMRGLRVFWRLLRSDASLTIIGMTMALGLYALLSPFVGRAIDSFSPPADALVPSATPAANAVVTAVTTSPPSVASPDELSYVVRHGDTLRSIAAEFLGSETGWARIYDANRERIPNPDSLSVGTSLTIPSD